MKLVKLLLIIVFLVIYGCNPNESNSTLLNSKNDVFDGVFDIKGLRSGMSVSDVLKNLEKQEIGECSEYPISKIEKVNNKYRYYGDSYVQCSGTYTFYAQRSYIFLVFFIKNKLAAIELNGLTKKVHFGYVNGGVSNGEGYVADPDEIYSVLNKKFNIKLNIKKSLIENDVHGNRHFNHHSIIKDKEGSRIITDYEYILFKDSNNQYEDLSTKARGAFSMSLYSKEFEPYFDEKLHQENLIQQKIQQKKKDDYLKKKESDI